MVPKTDYLSETAGSKRPEKLRSHSLLPRANRVRNGHFSSPEEPVPMAIPPAFRPTSAVKNCRFRCLLRRQRQQRFRIAGRHHEVVDARHDLGAETGTVEHAVMPDALLHIVH